MNKKKLDMLGERLSEIIRIRVAGFATKSPDYAVAYLQGWKDAMHDIQAAVEELE